MTILPPNFTTPERIDQVSETLQRHWYAGGQIVAYKPFDGNRETIMRLGELAASTIKEWSRTQPYLAIHDLSHPGVALAYSTRSRNILKPGITDEGTQEIQKIIDDSRTFRAAIAIVVSVQFSGHITSMFVQLEARRQNQNHIVFEVFTETEAALNWLSSYYP